MVDPRDARGIILAPKRPPRSCSWQESFRDSWEARTPSK
jgi:hypothetical protein